MASVTLNLISEHRPLGMFSPVPLYRRPWPCLVLWLSLEVCKDLENQSYVRVFFGFDVLGVLSLGLRMLRWIMQPRLCMVDKSSKYRF